MKWNPWTLVLLPGYLVSWAQNNGDRIQQIDPNCFRSVFVESPIADTYITYEVDSSDYGLSPVLLVSGHPGKKQKKGYVRFRVEHIDPEYVQSAQLKFYTAGKMKGQQLTLSALVTNDFVENNVGWSTQPVALESVSSQALLGAPFVIFDVTNYIREHLSQGDLGFQLTTNTKHLVEIAGRESGLGAELILTVCTSEQSLELSLSKNPESSFLKVLPNTLEGKLTLQTVGLPPGGFGELMFMTDHGQIVHQVPLAIQESPVTYHSLDLGPLLPGIYWAMVRKGRALVKDQFRLRPDPVSSFLKVDPDFQPASEQISQRH